MELHEATNLLRRLAKDKSFVFVSSPLEQKALREICVIANRQADDVSRLQNVTYRQGREIRTLKDENEQLRDALAALIPWAEELPVGLQWYEIEARDRHRAMRQKAIDDACHCFPEGQGVKDSDVEQVFSWADRGSRRGAPPCQQE